MEVFSRIKRKTSGGWYYNSWCNSCRTENNRLRSGSKKRRFSKVTETTKECTYCWEALPHSEFSPSTRGSRGLASRCRTCNNKTINRSLDKGREATKRYRENNREKYLASHRVTQFNRRNTIRVVDDGTLTEEVLISIYAKEFCHWCKDKVPRELRTLEHVIELSRGGVHGVSNCTMACFSCNSKRINKDGKYDYTVPTIR